MSSNVSSTPLHLEKRDLSSDPDRLTPIKEASQSLMDALKKETMAFDALSKGPLILGIKSRKVPVQVVQIPPKTPSLSNHKEGAVKVPQIARIKQTSSNKAVPLAAQPLKAVSLPTTNRIWLSGPKPNVVSTEHPTKDISERNTSLRNCGNYINLNNNNNNKNKNNSSTLMGSRFFLDRDNFNLDMSSRRPRQLTKQFLSRPDQNSNIGFENRLHGPCIQSHTSNDMRQNFCQRPLEYGRLPHHALSHKDAQLLKNFQSGSSEGKLSQDSYVKFTSGGLMQMMIPIKLELLETVQERKPVTGPSRRLESLSISKQFAQGKSPSSLIKTCVDSISNHSHPKTVATYTAEALNLITDDEYTDASPRVRTGPFTEQAKNCLEAVPTMSDTMNKVTVASHEQIRKAHAGSERADDLKNQNSRDVTMESMQPLLDAIEFMEKEEKQQKQPSQKKEMNNIIHISSKIKKGKRSQPKYVRKTGWRKFHSIFTDQSNIQIASPDCANLMERISLEKKASSSSSKRSISELLNLTHTQDKNKRRRKYEPRYCHIDHTNDNFDKTNYINHREYSDVEEKEEDNDDDDSSNNTALWRFLKEGRLSEDKSAKIHPLLHNSFMGGKRKSSIPLILPESAFSKKCGFYPSADDLIWTKVKRCADSIPQEQLEILIQNFSLCGFASALLEACSSTLP